MQDILWHWGRPLNRGATRGELFLVGYEGMIFRLLLDESVFE